MTEPSLPEESLFAQALEIASAAARAEFLDRACGENPALRAEVEALLRAHNRTGDLLDLPDKLPLTTDLPARERPGTHIGPYKLLEQIGEGGMGSVWMAEQTEPIRRRVAVKVIKEGMGSGHVLARFEAERQALALMEHPNIAKVLDAGTTPSGCPYFVMELVKGQPITKYCDEKRLGVRQRLELFADACRAVQHAHQKGIIHRDIKPSNVLVAPYDGRPVVKVIDFGVAKATGQRLTDRTLFTEFGALVGTPEYMSPEQAETNNQDVDTRSDIYSLGVLLYELLTGSTPLTRKRVLKAGLLEVLRVIREEEPPRPSTRLSDSKDALPSISAQRQIEPAKLTKLVRGELDWIVMKALEKERNRRYETANGFAGDVQRYLADEAVQACPPSTTYRARKFLRRNKGPVLAAGVVLVALIGGITGATVGLLRANTAEGKAQDEAWKAGQERDQANEARLAAQQARELADAAKEAEGFQRSLAEKRSDELRQNLYDAEMNLASSSTEVDLGLGIVRGLLARWERGEPDLRGWEWYYLSGLCNRDLFTFSIGAGPHVWSPDRTRLATGGGWDNAPRVWDAATRKETVILAYPAGRDKDALVGRAAWSPNGKLLAMRHLGGGMDIWDAVTGKEKLSILGRDLASTFRMICWSPDGTRLAMDVGKMVKVCDAATGKTIFDLDGHSEAEANNQQSLGLKLAWSPDGTRLASCGAFSFILWDVATGKVAYRDTLNVGGVVYDVSWHPDGTRLALAHGTYFSIRDATSGKRLIWMPGQKWAADGTRKIAWSPDGTRLLTAGRYGTLTLLDASSGKPIATIRGHSDEVGGVSWNAAGTRFTSSSGDLIKTWDADQKDEPLAFLGHGDSPVLSIAWSPDGKRLASTGADGAVKFRDAATARELLSCAAHTGVVDTVSWSPDGKRAATVSRSDNAGRVWDTASGKEVATFRTSATGFIAMAWNPKAQHLACIENIQVMLRDSVTGATIRAIPFPPGRDENPISVAWNPAGTHLVMINGSGFLLWDAATGLTRTVRGRPRRASAVAWSPDGTRLVSANNDRTLSTWDAATGKELAIFEGHLDLVRSVAWSPDGTRIASTGHDHTVRIWDSATGKGLLVIKWPNLLCVAWSPDGQCLAAAGYTAPAGSSIVIFDASRGYRRAGQPAPGPKKRSGVAATLQSSHPP